MVRTLNFCQQKKTTSIPTIDISQLAPCKLNMTYYITMYHRLKPQCKHRYSIHSVRYIWGVPKIGVSPKWMVYKGKPLLQWMIWGETPTIFGHIPYVPGPKLQFFNWGGNKLHHLPPTPFGCMTHRPFNWRKPTNEPTSKSWRVHMHWCSHCRPLSFETFPGNVQLGWLVMETSQGH